MPDQVTCPRQLWEDIVQTIRLLSTNPHLTPQGQEVVAVVLKAMEICSSSQQQQQQQPTQGIILCPK